MPVVPSPGSRETETGAWRGRPARGIRLRAADRFWIPMGVLIAASLLALITLVETLFSSTLLVVILASLWMAMGWEPVVGRFFRDARKRAAIEYVLEDGWIKGVKKKREHWRVSVAGLDELYVIREPGGLTTIRLQPRSWVRWWPGASWLGSDRDPPSLELLSEPGSALRAIVAARKEIGLEEPEITRLPRYYQPESFGQRVGERHLDQTRERFP